MISNEREYKPKEICIDSKQLVSVKTPMKVAASGYACKSRKWTTEELDNNNNST